MGRLGTVLVFVVAMAVVFLGFGPVGSALGDVAHGVYESLLADGMSPTTAALVPLLAADLLGLVLAFVGSYAGGVELPSGLPQAFFALFVPFTLAAMQQQFFTLAGDPGGLAETFGAYNFVAMLLLSIAASQLGVYLARRRFEARTAS